nr:uncharacterized protein LOC131771836 [Pocillopora verrucosa]XP_058956347.1 uncharacterized protein LOC131783605 [Pocillopora verrucosa]
MVERNSFAAKEWAKLTAEEKILYKSSQNIAGELNPEDIERTVKKIRDQIIKLVNILDGYGCCTAVLQKDPDGQLFGFGSPAGQDFLSRNPELMFKFKSHFGGADNKDVTYKDITALFNQKYSQMVGKPSRVPYLKGGFEVEGLPEDLPFRKPFMYGGMQMRRILEAKESIIFKPAPLQGHSDDAVETPIEQEPIPTEATQQILASLLAHIAGDRVSRRALSGGGVIKEEETEVVDLTFSNREMWILQSYGITYFDTDAWKGLWHNVQHDTEHDGGVILPVLSGGEDEKFWLFLCSLKLGTILKASSGKALKGHWLDRIPSSSNEYRLLTDMTNSVTKLNAIKLENGTPLYHLYYAMPSQNGTYKLDALFETAIEQAIRRLTRVNPEDF